MTALTEDQAERLRLWLIEQADAAELLSEMLAAAVDGQRTTADDLHRSYLRGQVEAWRSAERSLRVASVGAL